MKGIKSLLSLAFLSLAAAVMPQESVSSVDSFFKQLQMLSYSKEGVVRISQDERVVEKMRAKRNSFSDINEKPYHSTSGYRVQVFSSNAPKIAKNQAFGIESEIKGELSAPVYVNFSAPFWKVRVGDCRTYQEAVTLLNQLKSQFPGRKGMMYIVRENIRIYVY